MDKLGVVVVFTCVARYYDRSGPVAELADAADLKSAYSHTHTSVLSGVVAPFVLVRALR